MTKDWLNLDQEELLERLRYSKTTPLFRKILDFTFNEDSDAGCYAPSAKMLRTVSLFQASKWKQARNLLEKQKNLDEETKALIVYCKVMQGAAAKKELAAQILDLNIERLSGLSCYFIALMCQETKEILPEIEKLGILACICTLRQGKEEASSSSSSMSKSDRMRRTQEIFKSFVQPEDKNVREQEQQSRVSVLPTRSLDQLLQSSDPFAFTMDERRCFAEHMKSVALEGLLEQVEYKVREYNILRNELLCLQSSRRTEVLKSVDVIGATTTGAAAQAQLLQAAGPLVLLVEEAAEVLEAHIVASLSPTIQQVALIGDHFQLRPKIEHYRFATESGKGYNLDRSMFERLLAEKNLAVQLTTQRRMDPCISKLITPSIYPVLRDHECVKNYPEIKGMSKRLYFWNHSYPEAKDANLSSYCNLEEAQMVLALVKYLCLQGYEKNQITVLSPYIGQLMLLRKLLKKVSIAVSVETEEDEMDSLIAAQDLEEENSESEAVEKVVKKEVIHGRVKDMQLVANVRISTVDNFQGEESDVVIISCVRSNNHGKIGFVKNPNRLNVMLSRAKHGMYLVGNASTLSSSQSSFWKYVLKQLRETQCFGEKLGTRCGNHPDEEILINDAKDFERKTPDGGCGRNCTFRLPCGHVCGRFCHVDDRKHRTNKCYEPCPKVHKDCNHPCVKRCYESCDPCLEKVKVTHATCQHQETITCAESKNCKCKVKVNVLMPFCDHNSLQLCWKAQLFKQDQTSIELQCQSNCGKTLPCGHICRGACSLCRKNGHPVCTKKCDRTLACGHACEAKCHEGKPCPECPKPCLTRCIHSTCPLECSLPCPACSEPCVWECEHTGKCPLPCSAPCMKIPCNLRCSKTLSCGHRCPSLCGEICPSATQFCVICGTKKETEEPIALEKLCDMNLNDDPLIVLTCGHAFAVSSLDQWLGIATVYGQNVAGKFVDFKPLTEELSDSKGCPSCRAPISSVRRYGRVLAKLHFQSVQKKYLPFVESKLRVLEDKVCLLEKENAAKENISRKKLNRLGQQVQMFKESLKSPVAQMIDAVRVATKNDARTLHSLGLSEGTPFFKLQCDILDARCKFLKNSNDSAWLVMLGDVVENSSVLLLGRCEMVARFYRGYFLLRTKRKQQCEQDFKWIVENSNEGIRESSYAKECAKLLKSSELDDILKAIPELVGPGW